MKKKTKPTLFISLRYLFSKKSHNAINWVSGISVAGVATATAAMICVLSVFNGFRDLVASLFTAFDPELRVELVSGATVEAEDSVLRRLRASESVAVYNEVLQESALVRWRDKERVVTIKGVDENFDSLTNVASILLGNTHFFLESLGVQCCVPGIGVAQSLGLPITFDDALEVWAPKHGERVNMANPASSFRRSMLHSSGSIFAVAQGKYDDNIILTSKAFAQELFDMEGRVSHVELKLVKGADRKDVEKILDSRFRALDRYEQQSDSFRIMNIEKLMAYIFFSFILIIAAFNIVGSLSMLIIEKKDDAQTLRALGARESVVAEIFATEGRMIGIMGAVIGLVVGLILCWIQIEYGVITLGGSEDSFIVNAYPLAVEWGDVLLVFFTVIVVSWFTVLWPVRRIATGRQQK